VRKLSRFSRRFVHLPVAGDNRQAHESSFLSEKSSVKFTAKRADLPAAN
jgi:hypothetical protein